MRRSRREWGTKWLELSGLLACLCQQGPRKQGRPRMNWSTDMWKHAKEVCSSYQLEYCIYQPLFWTFLVEKYCLHRDVLGLD